MNPLHMFGAHSFMFFSTSYKPVGSYSLFMPSRLGDHSSRLLDWVVKGLLASTWFVPESNIYLRRHCSDIIL